MVRLKEGDINPQTKAAYTAEEIKENNDLIDLVATQVKEVTAGMIPKEDADKAVEKATEGLKAELKADYQKLYDAAIKMGTDVEHLKRTKAANKSDELAATLEEALFKAYVEKADEIRDLVNNKQQKPLFLNLNLTKAAVDMGIDTTIASGTSDSHYSLTSNTGIVSVIRKRLMKYLENVSVGATLSAAKPYAMWIEETDEQGTPIMIGEGDTKTQLSVRYEEREKKAKKIGVHGKVTTEMIRYLSPLLTYIKNNLMKRVQLTVEGQLFDGDDTGDNLAGIDGFATAFSAGAAASTIASANEFDVLVAVATQCKLAHGVPNGVFINPSTIQAMKAIKNTQGNPLWKDYMDIVSNDGGIRIEGMKVIESTYVTAGEFIGGDLSVIQVQFTDNISIQIGLDGNDFTKNKKTILVEEELVQFVSANDTACLIKGDFTTAKDALAAVA